ncbi:MAG: alpha-galactosidase, partial [Clostridia bacterium]|nr:alpha-galactosidase [Clostridia bacterium]
KEKTLPLVKTAAELGCEYYIMDAGWYGVQGDELKDLGMWLINDGLFGEEGLQGIFDYIISLGMKPGIWFEFESVGSGAQIVKEHPEYLLYRHGRRIGGDRCLYDFRNPGVREYLRSRVKALYDMGVRYIKNDYNANTGAGIDPDGAASLHEHTAAFYSFIDGLQAEFPDLVLENCGSGAMRSDNETLSHFRLQSVSDQEDFFRLPSIVSGTEACVTSGQCGIWVYPYPVKIDHRQTFKPSPEFTGRFKDGKTTVYCFVTGMFGVMYISGHIDCADEFNLSLMKEAVALHKRYVENIACGVPVYPTGTFDIDTDKTDTFGLIDCANNVLLLGVWNNSDAGSETAIDLHGYFSEGEIETVYPRLEGYGARLDGNKLTVKLPEGKSALFTAIRF